ncbi:hypothetical protein, partial [Paremcibacter congregatus]|uniref:hypothetical protein n=1 Tax=Paremcibacter congregatus TaxID=2043170 RepID=UPI003A924738
ILTIREAGPASPEPDTGPQALDRAPRRALFPAPVTKATLASSSTVIDYIFYIACDGNIKFFDTLSQITKENPAAAEPARVALKGLFGLVKLLT